MALAAALPNLKQVEWARWIRDPDETKSRIHILRNDMPVEMTRAESAVKLLSEVVLYSMCSD